MGEPVKIFHNTEWTGKMIEGGKKGDHSIVDIMETNGQISDERLKSTTIFKVNVGLRESNPAAYIPKLISIGPYHNKNPELRSMEKYKQLYLQRFLNRNKGLNVKRCMSELEKLKDKALMCYDGTKDFDEDIIDKFSEIMLLDGCFVVEFVRERGGNQQGGEDYQKVIYKSWIKPQACRDMVVLDNQLPFFVLTKLYDMTKSPNEESFLYMVIRTLLSISPKMIYIPKSEIDRLNAKKYDHLLHVAHVVSCPSGMTGMIYYGKGTDASKIYFGEGTDASKMNYFGERTDASKMNYFGERTDASKIKGSNFWNSYVIPNAKEDASKIKGSNLWNSYFIPNATELYEAGVSFAKIGSVDEDPTDKKTLLDIEFENGLLGIPDFVVQGPTETFIRNLIAFEQHSSYNIVPYFSHYVRIMSQLINSHKDVKLLRESGIIHNHLGDDKAVANIFNKLGDGVALSENFYYKEVCSKLNQHCQKPWNKMMANLRHNYFHSLWAGTSTVAAIVLLILTAMQTVLAFTGSVK